MPKPVFISYSTDDATITTTIREGLEARGIACWFAPRDIAPGKDYAEQIIEAIEEASIVLLVLSVSSNQSVFVLNEVERAVAKRKFVVPLRIQPVQPSRSLEFFISSRQWVEAWNQPLPDSIERLFHALHDFLVNPSVDHPIAHISGHAVTQQAPHNLPNQLTPFIGRATELAAVGTLLAEPNVRLITILGPGGMGKTRLSLAVGESHLADPRFVHGVYFVALAPLNQAQHIATTLAEVLSFPLQSGGTTHTPLQQLLDHLRTKQMLLIFDNFEHLLLGADVVPQILQAAPQIRILATSRERLRVLGEHLFVLQGLIDDEPMSAVVGSISAAAQLFLQSARQVQPDLVLHGEELAQVARICRLVEGMPLGIELAAAWSDVLSPAEIAGEIEQNLDFLGAEQRGGQEHQRSVRAVFDSTWNRLGQEEQAVFARLSVFRGGLTRESAQQVAGASLRLLSTLIGKSLLQHEREHGRYTLHELLRQFAKEKLLIDSQTADTTYDRHCVFYAALLGGQEERLKSRHHASAVGEIEAEIENIRAAWQWAVVHRKLDEIDHCVQSLSIFYITKCWYQEGASVFAQAADALQMVHPAGRQGVLLSKILTKQGWMLENLGAQVQGAYSGESAQMLYQRSLSILEIVGAQSQGGEALTHLGHLLTHAGDFERGLALNQEALTFYTQQHDFYGMSRTLHNLGYTCHWIGQYQEAIRYFQQGIAICEQRGDLRILGDILNLLSDTYIALDKYEDAKRAAQASLTARTAASDQRGIAWSLNTLGAVAWYQRDFVAAKQLAEASLALFREVGLTVTKDAPLNILGKIACSLGDYRQAKTHFFTILASHLEAGTLNDSWLAAMAITSLATVLAHEDKTAQAVELLTLVQRHPTAWHETRMQAAKLQAELAPDIAADSTAFTRPLAVVIAELLHE